MAAELGNVAVGHVEGAIAAAVAAGPYLQHVVTGVDRHLDRLAVGNRADYRAVKLDLELAAPKLERRASVSVAATRVLLSERPQRASARPV